MQAFITLTHCKKHHVDKALKAFARWKLQRKAGISNIRPVTPSRSEASHADSPKFGSDIKGMGFVISELDSPDYDELALDYNIEDEMKKLKLATSTPHTSSQTIGSDIEGVHQEIFETLGDDVHLPKEGEDYNHGKIYQSIKECLSDNSKNGILYILWHTQIPGLFKIGRSKYPETVRHGQNCYKPETKVLYATKVPFIGYSQAEKIAHAILRHKRLLIIKCLRCTKSHKEWYLTTEKEVRSVVKLAERWLKMPAYGKQDGGYRLTPKAAGIHEKLFQFTVPKMRKLIDEAYASDGASCMLPNASSATNARHSGTSAEDSAPRVLINEVPDIIPTMPPQGYNMRARSPAERTGGGGGSPLILRDETLTVHRRRSREPTPDGDGNYTFATELKITRVIRTKVSMSELSQASEADDWSEPAVFGSIEEKQRRTEVNVREV
jgi:hypothetical protein